MARPCGTDARGSHGRATGRALSEGRGGVVGTLVLPWPRSAFARLPDHALCGAAWGITYRALTRKHLPERQSRALWGASLRPGSVKILIVPKDRSHPFVPYLWTADHGATAGSQRSEVGGAHAGTCTGLERRTR